MQKKSLYLFLLCGFLVIGQECPRLSNPVDGSINVPVDITITWPAVTGIEGYLISLGTTPGGTEILNRRSAGPINSYTPDVGLPENTLIYVTISLFILDGPLKICPGESFFTGDVTTPPPCTQLSGNATNPDGSINWDYASTATGYRLTIGTSNGSSDISNDLDVGNVLTYRPIPRLPRDQPIYVRIVPYNENGDTGPCTEENFTIGETLVDCTQFLPPIDFPDQVGICPGAISTDFLTATAASGLRWFKINSDNSEELISEGANVALTEVGNYRLEAINVINRDGNLTECTVSKVFRAVASEAPRITSVSMVRESNGLQLEIMTSGHGDYEYALDDETGPYQESPIFTGVSNGEHRVFVRDKNGCGIADRLVAKHLDRREFPAFFTPNGDGVNDHWQFVPALESGEVLVELIRIYDRFGNLIYQLDPKSQGWDGNFKGNEMPSSDYWFWAVTFGGQRIQGNFTLKR